MDQIYKHKNNLTVIQECNIGVLNNKIGVRNES